MQKKREIISFIFFLVLLSSIFSFNVHATKISNIDDYFKDIRTTLDQLNAQYDKMSADYKACITITNNNRDTCYANVPPQRYVEGNKICSNNWDISYKQCEEAEHTIYVANNAAREKLYAQLESDLDQYYSGWSQDQIQTAYNLASEQETACYPKEVKYMNDCPADLGGISCSVRVFNADICLIPKETRVALGKRVNWGGEQTEQNSNEHLQVKQEGNFPPPTKNENENRGRDVLGRINPSIGGYLGDAYVQRADGTKVIPGKELYLKVDDVIATGQKANVNIMFSSTGKMNLGPNTVVRVGNALLDQYYLAKGTFKTQLNWGSLPPQRLEFRTPNANIISTGTEFVVDYNETTNTTTVYLNEGNLEIDVKDKTINLTAGNYLIIYSNGTTRTNPLEAEKWTSLGNNFYEFPESTTKTFKSFLIIMFLGDIISLVVLTWWMKKKIKKPNKKDNSTKKGTVSLVLGIMGIILVWAPYFGLILSSIAFCLSRIQKVNKPTGLATAGLILGIIGILLNIIVLVSVFMTMMIAS